jgi:hypothetical protein
MNVAKLFNCYFLGYRLGMIFCNNSHEFVREKIPNTELLVADPTRRDRDINGTTLEFEQWSSRRPAPRAPRSRSLNADGSLSYS